jgi:hypothetical protein
MADKDIERAKYGAHNRDAVVKSPNGTEFEITPRTGPTFNDTSQNRLLFETGVIF